MFQEEAGGPSLDICTFRELNNTSVLSNVTLISSVSGGTWFLTKLVFDEDFADKLLLDDVPIGDVVSEWFRADYFAEIQRSEQPRQYHSDNPTVKGSLSKIVSQVAGPIKQSLGTVIIAADRFDLSWQEVVETSVLWKEVANITLVTANVTPVTRAKFGQQFIMSYNWNQLHEWRDNNTRWFLKKKLGKEVYEYVQYPVYTSTQYKQLDNG